MSRPVARSAAAIIVSGSLLVGLYLTIDIRGVASTLLRVHPLWLAISVGTIIPITLARALRFYWTAPPGSLPGVGEALRLTLVSSTLNVFMPAKTGDLVKSYFIASRSGTSAGMSVAVVVYERLCDVFALVGWSLLGWWIGRPDVPGMPRYAWIPFALIGVVAGILVASGPAAAAAHALAVRLLPGPRLDKARALVEGWPQLLTSLQGRRRKVIPLSIALWLAHLVQIWMFTVALSLRIPFMVAAGLSSLALMAGQLPFTLGGVGARDVALVVLLSRYAPPEAGAALGILISTRGFIPPLMGLPILPPYLRTVVAEARRWRAAGTPP